MSPCSNAATASSAATDELLPGGLRPLEDLPGVGVAGVDGQRFAGVGGRRRVVAVVEVGPGELDLAHQEGLGQDPDRLVGHLARRGRRCGAGAHPEADPGERRRDEKDGADHKAAGPGRHLGLGPGGHGELGSHRGVLTSPGPADRFEVQRIRPGDRPAGRRGALQHHRRTRPRQDRMLGLVRHSGPAPASPRRVSREPGRAPGPSPRRPGTGGPGTWRGPARPRVRAPPGHPARVAGGARGSFVTIAWRTSATTPPSNGTVPREDLVEERSQREDVGPGVGPLPTDLLWRHVVRRAHDRSGPGDVGGPEPRQPEVEDLDVPGRLDVDIAGLQVPVDDALGVGEREAVAQLHHDLELPAQVAERALPQGLAQVEPLEELHRHVGDPGLLAEVEHGDDVRVVEPCRRLRLALEALPELRVGGEGRADRLQGDVPVEKGIVGLVHLAHRTLADLPDDPILPDPVQVHHRPTLRPARCHRHRALPQAHGERL